MHVSNILERAILARVGRCGRSHDKAHRKKKQKRFNLDTNAKSAPTKQLNQRTIPVQIPQ